VAEHLRTRSVPITQLADVPHYQVFPDAKIGCRPDSVGSPFPYNALSCVERTATTSPDAELFNANHLLVGTDAEQTGSSLGICLAAMWTPATTTGGGKAHRTCGPGANDQKQTTRTAYAAIHDALPEVSYGRDDPAAGRCTPA
jgi:hypothetical protein